MAQQGGAICSYSKVRLWKLAAPIFHLKSIIKSIMVEPKICSTRGGHAAPSHKTFVSKHVNNIIHFCPPGPKLADSTTLWSPTGEKMQTVLHFGAQQAKKCRQYYTLEPNQRKSADSTTLWGTTSEKVPTVQHFRNTGAGKCERVKKKQSFKLGP